VRSAAIFDRIGSVGSRLTVVTSERINEWNINCQDLSDLVSREYRLGYLSESEIDVLLGLLEKHRSLGVLERKSTQEREEAFKQRAGRQLLVALHEATLGRRLRISSKTSTEELCHFRLRASILRYVSLTDLGFP